MGFSFVQNVAMEGFQRWGSLLRCDWLAYSSRISQQVNDNTDTDSYVS